MTNVLAAILLAAFGLRVLLLDQQSLWYDEAYSVFYARAGLNAIAGQKQADPIPYFMALWGWVKLAGHGEYAVRYLSVALGTLTIPLLYQVVRAAGSRLLGIIAAAALAVSAFHVYYSQEARLHIAAGLLAALIICTLIQAVRRETAWRWLAYGLAAAAGMYTYYYLALLLLGLNLPLLASRKISRSWWLANAGALALALPGLVLAYLRVTAFKEPYVPTLGPPALQFFAIIPAYVFVDSGLSSEWIVPLSAIVLVLAAFAFLSALRQGGLIWSMLAWGFAVPAVGVFAIPAVLNVFSHPRYEIVALPALLALLVWSWRHYALRMRWLRPAGVAFLLLPSGAALLNSYTNSSFQRDDNRGALALTRQEALAGEILVYDLPLQYDVLDYYGRDLGIPSQGLPIPRNPALPRDRQFVAATGDRAATEQRLAELSGQYAGLWLLLSGDPVQWTEDWLDVHRTTVLNRWFGRVRLKHYRPLPGPDLSLPDAERAARSFGPLRLEQVKVARLTLGKPWPVYFLWSAGSPPAADYTISAQLFNSAGQRVAQLDSQPFNGWLPTSQWLTGKKYQDTMLLTLPNSLPSGVYELRVSVYDKQGLTGQQTPILRLLQGEAAARQLMADADAGWTLQTVRLGSAGALALDGVVRQAPSADYTWFVHLLEPSGRLLAQDDRPPVAPTSAWRPGDRFSEIFVVPAAPAGAKLEIGAYDASGRRVSFRNADGSATDHLELPL